jgi:hypothetical protein
MLEVPDQFLLFRIDRDHRVTGLEELFGPLVDVPELLVPVGMLRSFLGLALGLQAVAGRLPPIVRRPLHGCSFRLLK